VKLIPQSLACGRPHLAGSNALLADLSHAKNVPDATAVFRRPIVPCRDVTNMPIYMRAMNAISAAGRVFLQRRFELQRRSALPESVVVNWHRLSATLLSNWNCCRSRALRCSPPNPHCATRSRDLFNCTSTLRNLLGVLLHGDTTHSTRQKSDPGGFADLCCPWARDRHIPAAKASLEQLQALNVRMIAAEVTSLAWVKRFERRRAQLAAPLVKCPHVVPRAQRS